MGIVFGIVIFISLYGMFYLGYHLGSKNSKDSKVVKDTKVKKVSDGITARQASDVLKPLFTKTVAEMAMYDAQGNKKGSDTCVVVAGALKKAIDILDGIEDD